ncbi:unnamed protein product [Prorocentrum cordatum]|uniref:Prolyl 4-hydroxylase alpha subunit Fe(2+) 2OG dioxygenase domain-containing protein n=1 Tax=Prorocentrum cordatum TaxID=2364126 RepID=A0ABN9W434_9DINO|nr:unnamed protein product [Polarella glacialis]
MGGAAGAFRELCGARAGCAFEADAAGPPSPHRTGAVSLPPVSPEPADLSKVLDGWELNMWTGDSCDAAAADGPDFGSVCSDPALVKRPALYGEFCIDLRARGTGRGGLSAHGSTHFDRTCSGSVWTIFGFYRLEGRALVMSVRRLLRSRAHLNTRALFLVDNLALALALAKGRARSRHLLPTCREVAALGLFPGCRFHVRWVPGELNPADAPSRGRRAAGRVDLQKRADAYQQLFDRKAGEGSLSLQRGLERAALRGYFSDERAGAVGRPAHEMADYLRRLGWFSNFVLDSGLTRDSNRSLDEVVTEWFDILYQRGHSANDGSKFLAALRHLWPELEAQRQLPRAWRAAQGWRKLAPVHSPAPLPFSGLMGRPVAVLIAFAAYLRPGDLFGLAPQSLVPPVEGAGGPPHWGLLLGARELGRRNKTGEFDESVLLDWPGYEWIGTYLEILRERPVGRPVWTFDAVHLISVLLNASLVSGVRVLWPQLRSRRHGGASFDAISKRRPLVRGQPSPPPRPAAEGRLRFGAFLELFAGAKRIASGLRRAGGAAVTLEIADCPLQDAALREVRQVLLSWIQQGLIDGVWLGTPCSSWSAAGRGQPGRPGGPLRDRAHIWGHPSALARHPDRENPIGSLLWNVHGINLLCRLKSSYQVTLDYCQASREASLGSKVRGPTACVGSIGGLEHVLAVGRGPGAREAEDPSRGRFGGLPGVALRRLMFMKPGVEPTARGCHDSPAEKTKGPGKFRFNQLELRNGWAVERFKRYVWDFSPKPGTVDEHLRDLNAYVKALDGIIRELIFGFSVSSQESPVEYLASLGVDQDVAEWLASYICSEGGVFEQWNVDPKVTSLVARLHEGSWFSYGSLGTVVRSHKGGRQGCIFGATVFNAGYSVPIKMLHEEMRRKGITLRVRSGGKAFWGTTEDDGEEAATEEEIIDATFVDDECIVLVAASPQLLDRAIQTLLEVLCRLHEDGVYVKSDHDGAIKLSIVSKYKHLGTVVSIAGTCKPDAEKRASAAMDAYAPVAIRVFGAPNISIATKMHAVKARILTKLMFHAHVVTPDAHFARTLNQVYMRVLRRIVDKVRFGPGQGTDLQVRQSLGAASVDCLAMQARLRYLRRLLLSGRTQLLALLSSKRNGKMMPYTRVVLDDLTTVQMLSSQCAPLGDPSENAGQWLDVICGQDQRWHDIAGAIHFSKSKCDSCASPDGVQLNFACDMCPGPNPPAFATRLGLVQHKRAVHGVRNEARRYVSADGVCPLCHKDFRQRFRCIRHLSGSPPNACTEMLRSGAVEPLPNDLVESLDSADRALCRKHGALAAAWRALAAAAARQLHGHGAAGGVVDHRGDRADLAFTLLLTESWWREEDGGALEVYGPTGGSPAARLPPRFNTLVVHPASLCSAVTRVTTEEAPRLAIHGVFRQRRRGNSEASAPAAPAPLASAGRAEAARGGAGATWPPQGAAAGAAAGRAVTNAFQQQLEGMRTEVTTIMGAAHSDIQKTVLETMRPQAARLDAHDQDIRSLQNKTDSLTQCQQSLRHDLDAVQRSLAQAQDAQDTAIDLARLAQYDRHPDPSVFRIGCAQHTAFSDFEVAIANWIKDAGLEASHTALYGGSPGKLFHLHLPGGPAGVARAVRLAQHLQLPGGSWRRFTAKSAAGGQEPLYINPDKAPKQVRRKVHGKRLLGILQRMYQDKVVAEYEIDFQSVSAQFKQQLQNVDTSAWRLKTGKLNHLFLRRHLIMVQEVHGNELMLTTLPDQLPVHYQVFYSGYLNDEAQIDHRTGGVESPLPTHYDRATHSLNTIDRLFISIRAHFATDCDITLNILQEADKLSDYALSAFKTQVTSMRQALAWNPSQRRLVLNGLKNDQPADGGVIRQPEEMADAIRQHWEPVFSAVNSTAATRFGLPLGYLNAVSALAEDSVGFLNVGSKRIDTPRHAISALVPGWTDFAICSCCRYLGFSIGPGASEEDQFLATYLEREIQQFLEMFLK